METTVAILSAALLLHGWAIIHHSYVYSPCIRAMDQHSKVMCTLTWVVEDASRCGVDHGYALNVKAHQDMESTMAMHSI